MADLLYLAHRLPYPPNKGDKVRSFNLLKHLAKKHRVHLGTFIDDPDDEVHLEKVRSYCATMHVARLTPRIAKLRSLTGLLSGEALSLPYYRNAALRDWAMRTCADKRIERAVVFSSVMASYVPDMLRMPTLVDFVDVDSAKWTQYATTHSWPLSWLYRREGERLLAWERAVAAQATHSFFVTEAEADMFRRSAPESADRVEAIGNGVDAEFFSPEHPLASPFSADEIPIVFTGAMDYWPNIDAVVWFVGEVLPHLRRQHPKVRFYVVGRSPDATVQALAKDNATVVTGTVDDVRPYLKHAAVVVAPLRIARGIQNKVLEAMAMARPVIAATACAGPIAAERGSELLAAATPDDYLSHIDKLLADPTRADAIGQAARRRILTSYSWDAHLSRIDRYLESQEAT
ncbi:MAG: TIGR03087 family PEP-CTERM/XrtA system glycosyltransferase [Gammaproteobacteria bacterium]|nr:TIGR03087 family PEP-CTERM/XrtA system glycosyltransferase [Gammaproteobacteria bacterium]MBU3990061.1 TIGR03087 family PEP-CTERM/XrtA system glycosyltransferase [Gammaproteobacteria bacterium]MBU4006135.1 TIGR03087 family PEP-CTERM/XrtA system glycosyltransferase [Gammaproteobacteria bacterium]MBU4022590.1 TIGR03087 family PEP-CTERM/XrtA system glycosyltransferase [Gammaproteobacteria bacterium]MBU4097090.1 TIGR03087 family PEP-CTERM/XrtA system glycosyltransferase [Gammaproteobacteria bact